MLLCIIPGGEFQVEIEANAALGGIPPAQWLGVAVRHCATLLRTLSKGDGHLVIGKGNVVNIIEDLTLDEYRASPSLSIYPGTRPTDLGGYPVGTPIWEIEVEDSITEELMTLAGTTTPEEAVCYAIWRQARFASALREDYPEWEPGIVLADGIFHSLSVKGAMRPVPHVRL